MFKKVVKLLFALVLSLSIVGCANDTKEVSTIGELMQLIVTKMDLPKSSSTEPYYVNIDQNNEYYDAVQSAVDWQIISPSIAFNTSDELTKEWLAYTMCNIIGENLDAQQVNDSSKSRFPDEVNLVVTLGLMDVDNRQLFNPKETISIEQASTILDKAISMANNKEYSSSYFDYDLKEDTSINETIPKYYDRVHEMALYDENSDIEVGQIVHWEDETGEYYYKVSDMNSTSAGKVASLTVPEIQDIYQDVDLETTFEANLNDADIEMMLEEDLFEVEPESISYADTSSVELLASGLSSKSFTYKDFTISFKTSSSGASVEVTRTGPLGSKMYARAAISGITPTVKWKMDGLNIEEGYFKINFNTTESIGFKTGVYKDLYADASKVEPSAFLSSLTQSFSEKKDVVEQTIPLCTINLPIPNAPVFAISMQLQLHVYASGRIELALSNAYTVGMEIRNNNLRMISDNTHKADFVIKASGNALLGIKFGLKLATFELADITLEGGVKALLQSVVHIYDTSGNMQTILSDVPTDIIDEVSQDKPDVLVCGDLKAYWVLDLVLNSSKTLCGKLHLSKTFHLLNESNALLIPGMKTHIENWQFVDKCTRGSLGTIQTNNPILSTDTIKISNYSLIVHLNNSVAIKVTGLPEGIGLSDLRYESNNPDIAKVDGSGSIVGISPGSTIVTIKTADDKYTTKCNVLVSESQ